MTFVIVPNELRDAIYEKVDKALEKAPQFKDKREEIFQRMLGYYNETGRVADFSLEPSPRLKEHQSGVQSD